ncbi:MAG: hypothetical protein JWQ88_3536 [Rhodoferax sp.]|nr:hypothetical protein [Rhodoferax sp.]
MSLGERDGLGKAPESGGGMPLSSLADLRRTGGAAADPVRFHYLERLSARLASAPPALRPLLQARLDQGMADHAVRLAAARQSAEAALAGLPPQPPGTAREARRLLAAGDHRGVRRLVARVTSPEAPSPLVALNRHIAGLARRKAHGESDGNGAGHGDGDGRAAANPVELDSMRRFRETWSRIAAEDQVQRAMGRGPENAGPLNSQMLVLRSLALMRELSPQYLRRFMAHAEALLWLEHEGKNESKNDSSRPQPVEARPARRARQKK